MRGFFLWCCAASMLLVLGVLVPLGAQTSFLAREIEGLEALAAAPATRHSALVRLARLYQLSGNREKALEYWNAAIVSEPNTRDDHAYLEALKILISLGEYERASIGLRNILSTNRDEEIFNTALYLSAMLDAFRNGNPAVLSQLSEHSGYVQLRSTILYTLWRITGDASWKNKLAGAFPRSPEAQIARAAEGYLEGPAIRAAATAQWLLFPGRESLGLAASAGAAGSAGAAAPADLGGWRGHLRHVGARIRTDGAESHCFIRVY